MDNKNEQNPDFSALVEAINCNDVIKVNTILSNGFDVNQYGKNRTTPLEFAVERENPQLVEILLNAGAEPVGVLMLVLRDIADKHNYKLT